jgi:hypothetical protein
MIHEENIIKISACFNDERTHRYKLTRTWSDDPSLRTATIIMSHASSADVVKGDLTTLLVTNNLASLNFRAFTTVNLFSRITSEKLDLSGRIEDFTNDENMKQILQSVQETDVTIIAIGSLANTYKKVRIHQNRLFDLLRDNGCQDKIFTIAASDGTEQLHPLSGKLRRTGSWKLVEFVLPSPPIENNEAEDNKNITADKKAKKK